VLVKHLCNKQLSFLSFCPAVANMGISVALKVMLMPIWTIRHRRTFCLVFPRKKCVVCSGKLCKWWIHWTCMLYIHSGRILDYHTDWSMNAFHFHLLLPLCGPIHNYQHLWLLNNNKMARLRLLYTWCGVQKWKYQTLGPGSNELLLVLYKNRFLDWFTG
jgi:hypothetical protein